MKTEPLSAVAEIQTGLPTKSWNPAGRGHPDKVVTVRSLELADRVDPFSEVEPLGAVENKHRLRAGDLVLPARSTAWRPALAPASWEGMPFNATLLAVRCSSQILPEFLLAWLSHPEGEEAIRSLSQSGTAQMNLTQGALAQLRTPVPPLELQHRFVTLLAATDDSRRHAIAAAEARWRLAHDIVFQHLAHA